MFMFGFSLASLGASSAGSRHFPRARAPAKEKEELLYLCLFLGSLLVPHLSSFLLPECKGCFAEARANIGQYLDGLDKWKAVTIAIMFLFHGLIMRLLFDLIQEGKARRNMHLFLYDCCANGSIRAIYERTSHRYYGPFEWILHDMLRDEHDLPQITELVIESFENYPVYIAMDIPPENVLQKLEQYNLVTKYGYERLPPPKPDHYFPHGGSMLHFYYGAEYVRIWG